MPRGITLGFQLAASILVVLISGASWLHAADTVVVCPEPFRAALRPWLAHREAQGHSFVFVDNTGTADAVRARIVAASKEHKLKFAVLVGDVPGDVALGGDSERSELRVPTFHLPSKVNVLIGGEKDIASDNAYGDLDGDHVPELAVGRLTADSAQELSLIVQKILAHEAKGASSCGPWCRRVQIVAGVGGFGQIADAALESCARKFITDGIPAEFATTMTYASWRSPYCPDPREFRDATLDRLNEGGLLFVYIGHGSPRGLDWVRTPDGSFHPILDAGDVGRLKCANGAPVAVMLACSTAHFDGSDDCLAEDMLRHVGGPVAVVGGSRVTMPYGLGTMAQGMISAAFEKRLPTLGEVFLHAKRELVLAKRDDAQSKTLDFLAGALNIHDDLPAERLEHVHLIHLIGDPLLRLGLPSPIEVSAPSSAEAGSEIEVLGKCSLAGECLVELAVRRDRLRFNHLRREFSAEDDALVTYGDVYRRANDPVVTSVRAASAGGRISAKLKIPPDLSGACHVRLLLESKEGPAAGAAAISVSKKP
ncbi:MAG: hypothetical protein HYS13_13970 [Planctomycetia bacterium]|nr:hypothetical protein [Planctomycetia bacterium]